MQSQAIHQHQQVEEAGQQQQGCAVLMRASADEGLGVVEQASQKVRAAGQRFRQGAADGVHNAVDHLPQIPLALLGTQRAPEPRDVAAYVVDTISVSYHGNNTTHLDAPSHIYYKGRLYNGYPQSSYTDRGAGKDDVMSMKNGIFTRGVLFDMPKLKEVSYLGDNEAIYVEDLEAWEKKAGFHVDCLVVSQI